MKSIRPLITITILTVVGVILYFKIQEGPTLAPEEEAGWANNSVPALQTQNGTNEQGSLGNTAAATSAPPAYPAASQQAGYTLSAEPAALQNSAAPTPLAATTSEQPPSNAVTSLDGNKLPQVPEIPDLPPFASAPGDSTATPAGTVATARYDNAQPPATLADTSTEPAVSGQVPSLGTSTPDLTPVSPISNGSAGVSSAFAMARPAIQAALERNELPRAHLLLTQWYGDRSLPAAEQQEIDSLLSQLAGTVIYSTEHRLEPAYTVQAGETLETIATKYQVPWQLFAKINGVPRADAVQPGQQLKVLRGPFAGYVNLSANELVLLLGGRYAGRFTTTLPSMTVLDEGQWVVQDKLLSPASQNVTQVSTAAATGPAVDRVIVLRNAASTTPGESLTISASQGQPTYSANSPPANIQVSPQAVEELFDILSIGSQILIRR